MKHRQEDENGLVAIIVATMIMIIMSLIVLGFARIMQREQRQALDKSLSTQAFYAAESGINDAVTRIHDITQPPLADKNDCDTSNDPAKNPSKLIGTIDGNLDTGYTCLLINNAPRTLEYTQKSVTTTGSTIVPIRGSNDELIDHAEVSWDEGSKTSAFRSCPDTSLPATTSWTNSPGILRLDLIPADGALTRAGLISNAMNAYLYPSATCGTNSIGYGSYTGVNAGQIVSIHCLNTATPHECVATITGLNMKYFYLRMRSVYNASNVTVKIFDASNKQLAIKGAQVQLDSTGRVADVVRRIQVRVPLNPTYEIPDGALETTLGICKQLAVIKNNSATQSPACSGF